MGVSKYRDLQNKLLGRYGKAGLCKRSLTRFLVRKIRTDLIFANLKSLLPQPTRQIVAPNVPSYGYQNHNAGGFRKDTVDCTDTQNSISKETIESNGSERLPRVRVEHEGLNVFIRIIAARMYSGLQSKLFQVLEELSLDIMQSQGFWREDKVFYSIHVKIVPLMELDVELLNHRLYIWARNKTSALQMEGTLD